MMKNATRFLVTAIGTVAASAVISELRKYTENCCILGADINESKNIVSSKDVDEFYVFPNASENQNAYLDFVLDFCKKHGVEYLYAFIDEEVENLSRHKDLFEAIGTRLCLTDNATVRICHFKNFFYDWMEKNFPMNAIRTYSAVTQIHADDFPLFVKPIEGRASIGCKIIDSFADSQLLDLSRCVVQEFVSGDIYVADVIRRKKTGEFLMCQRKEILRNGNGCGIAVEITDIPEIYSLAELLAKKLDVDGIISVEFFLTRQNELKVIEINPRIPAGISYSCLAGFNAVVNQLRIAQDLPLISGINRIGARFARRYETYEM